MSIIEVFKIDYDWDIGYIRRYIVRESEKLGFNSTEIGEISIVINELCTNFIKHKVVDGTLSFRILNESDGAAIEIIAQDKGPGIKNVDEVIKDGISSKGTMGGGLGAIKRLMDSFEIYSCSSTEPIMDKSTHLVLDSCSSTEPYSDQSTHLELDSIGTLIILKKWTNNIKYEKCDIKLSLLSKPYPGMEVNGDYCYVKKIKNRCIFAVIDGLGHGVEANKVSKLAAEIIDNNTHKSIENILIAINNGLRYTRGVVAGIILIDTIKKEFQYSAVGNIELRYLLNGKTERLIPSNGLLGAHENRKIKVHKKIYEKNSIITMCSDGIINKWDCTLMEFNHPTELANFILKNFAKSDDDVTVLVAMIQ